MRLKQKAKQIVELRRW